MDAPAAQTIANPEPTAVIVPVYNAPDELDACIVTVLRNTWGRFRLILIDDASPDPKIADILSAYERTPGVEVHRNPENLGFTRTINRGIELAGRADVVFSIRTPRFRRTGCATCASPPIQEPAWDPSAPFPTMPALFRLP